MNNNMMFFTCDRLAAHEINAAPGQGNFRESKHYRECQETFRPFVTIRKNRRLYDLIWSCETLSPKYRINTGDEFTKHFKRILTEVLPKRAPKIVPLTEGQVLSLAKDEAERAAEMIYYAFYNFITDEAAQ